MPQTEGKPTDILIEMLLKSAVKKMVFQKLGSIRNEFDQNVLDNVDQTRGERILLQVVSECCHEFVTEMTQRLDKRSVASSK